MKFINVRKQWARFRRHFIRFTWGGAWAAGLPEERRQNLTYFFFDGLFAAASDKILLTYITVYLLALGASAQQVGLLSSLSNFAAALLLLPAAMLVERTGERKKTALLAGAGSRTAVLLLAVLPMFIPLTKSLIWVLLGMALLREVMNNIGYPGWMALTGDLVPLEGRGRYFGTRNFIMGVAGIITALVVGAAITRIGAPLGFQVAFIFAVVLGLLSLLLFSRIKDFNKEDGALTTTRSNLRQIFSSLKGQKPFNLFCIFTAIWNFSISVAAPFFNVYMVNDLKMTAAMIGTITVVNAVSTLLVQRPVGRLSDKWGNRKVMIIFIFLIPLAPVVWGIWVGAYWQAILVEIFSGIFWGSFDLVNFNSLLHKTPQAQRARFSAFYQIVVTLSLAGGAALGSYLFPLIQFRGITLVSGGGRLLAGLLFLVLVHDIKAPEKKEANLTLDTETPISEDDQPQTKTAASE
ncbi:MFS transporter [bacterium]|nr:MFS transporter [bacterium]